MKEIFIIIVLSLNFTSLPANEMLNVEFPIVNAYATQYKGKRNIEENRVYLRDACFIDANEYIYNANKQKSIEITLGDAHDEGIPKKGIKKVADYESALSALGKCALDGKNPIAAWEALFIINSYIGLNVKTNGELYKKLSEMLYKEKSCDGFLNYGDVFNKGILAKTDKEKALEIYNEGIELCDDGWHKIVLEMRTSNIKRSLK